jgi:predicted ATPase
LVSFVSAVERLLKNSNLFVHRIAWFCGGLFDKRLKLVMQTASKTSLSIPEARASSFKKFILRLRYKPARP